MRRGSRLLGDVCVAALAAGPALAAPHQLHYQLTFNGQLSVAHSDQGLQSNGAACGLGTPDDTSPFDDHYTLSLRWSTTFNVTLKGKRVTVAARTTRVRRGSFSYGGYAYDFNCNEIVYGPAGQPCAGTVMGSGPGVVTARGSPERNRATFAVRPFGALVGTPSSCTVGVQPQVTYMAADELDLASLGQVAAQTFRVGAIKRARTFRYKLDRATNCSVAPQSPGETDTCSTTYAGGGSLRVRPN
jgi:hypothetical protein